MADRKKREPMERKRLANTDIDGLKPFKDRRREIIDTGCDGLRLRITTSGKRSWSVVYRVAGQATGEKGLPKKGPPRRVTLGSTEMPYKVARRKALEVIEMAAEGGDYIEKRSEEASGRSARSVEALIDRFIDEYAKRKGREELARQWLKKPEVKKWHGKELAQIARADIHLLLDRVAVGRGKAAAIEMRKHLSKLFHWAVDRQLISSNPITRLDRDEVYVERDRVLSLDELRRVWDACGDEKGEDMCYPFGPLYRMIILTGARRAEIAEMERGWRKEVKLDMDDEETVPAIVIPPSKHKSRRGHTIYLSPPAVAVLDSIPDLGGKYLFSSTAGKTPVSGYSKGKARLDRILADRAEKDELEPMEHWTVHDIRRSVATGMAEMGVPGEHIEHVLGHSVEKLRRTYNKHTYASEVREALLRWGALWA
ncbi:tyrosine-type recombinase/integrase [Tsuneonella mangrovi]|uniref:tyrosine-type recombinase/integrase n=1 Tax=Tsuneonella mangrovi TaxID=1982042 RepID=UPI000BA21760|nr:integrase family protein [Tsuneonella mangrovi]